MTATVAVIPAAGRGTRMRPATRIVPKALVTVVDRPA
ncbi:MAG TPA: UTP--glucose-1-phosphate uridylyltransferase, partial [Acidimicrobiia bacterium]|nr:UTP--glucose-1-phosphate uridylyltransferase [Acidimicrobiia bacterium]